ncbi:hypothetical protein ACF05T_26425 [Streptomyces lateritius]|uniref:Uncharacterized protein n=1 Tax=Streptomyces lateritius TaxID=67313 RepID=A0ABW6YIC6_9ACTN
MAEPVTPVKDVLESLARTLQPVITPRPGGALVDATIEPLPGQVEIAQIVDGAVDMTFITKDVRFAGFKPEAALTPAELGNAITGGQPLGGVTAPSGVNGLLGQLTGSIPMLSKTQVPVQLEVVWSVQDENGNQLADDQWDIAKGVPFDDGGTPKIKGTEIAVAFKPLVDELTTTNPVPAPVRRQLVATVTLKALGKNTDPVALPPVPVLIPTLLVPKLIAAFRHGEFQPKAGDEDGFVFLMVPGHSPLRSADQLKTTLATLQQTLTTLKSFADFAAFLLRIDSLVSGLTASPYVAFAAEDGVPVLNDTTVIQNNLLTNDIELEDEISSMIFIGPPGKVVHWFCEDDFLIENGDFSLKVGPQLFSLIRNLTSANPVSDPAGMVTVHHAPEGGSDTFNDFLSSVKFE